MTHTTPHTPRRAALPVWVATLLALSLGSAWAQSSGSTGTGSGAGSGAPMAQSGTGAATRSNTQQGQNVARVDRRFMEEAAVSGQFALQAAQLARTKSGDPAVKDYADVMVDYRTSANRELMALAQSKGLELSNAPSRAMRREIEELGKKMGGEFDEEFVRKVGVKEHEKEIKRYQEASKNVKDMQLKTWIDKALPTLEQHLAQAQKLPQSQASSARWGAGGSSGSSTSGASPQAPSGSGGYGSGNMGK
jgi:putative membrane protein